MNAKNQCTTVQTAQDLVKVLGSKGSAFALFYASWCPFCARFLPIFTRKAGEEQGNFVLVQDDRESIADDYAVTIYPTVLFFENGIVAKRLAGAAGVGLKEEQLTEFLHACA